MPIQKTSAIVLKSINWKDSSKITTLFTREMGKVNVMAKGAKKAHGRYSGLLESLHLLEVLIYFSTTRELQTLGEVSLEYSFNKIRADLVKTAYAFGILELLDKLFTHGNPDATFFDFSKRILYYLEESDKEQGIFWYYLLKLASYLGFKPEFTRCRKCGRDILEEEVRFSLTQGSILCRSCFTAEDKLVIIPKMDVKMLVMLQQTKHTKITSHQATLVKRLNITDFLIRYLEYHTGQKLELSSLKLSGS